MIDEVLAGLPAAREAMLRDTGRWTCLGVLGLRADVDAVRSALGPQFELTAEPYEAGAAVGGHPWIRPRTTWEVWARALAPAS